MFKYWMGRRWWRRWVCRQEEEKGTVHIWAEVLKVWQWQGWTTVTRQTWKMTPCNGLKSTWTLRSTVCRMASWVTDFLHKDWFLGGKVNLLLCGTSTVYPNKNSNWRSFWSRQLSLYKKHMTIQFLHLPNSSTKFRHYGILESFLSLENDIKMEALI